MTVLYMRFLGQFSQIGFSCYLVWKHSKNTHGTHFWGCWAFFSENQHNVMNYGVFCPFGKKCCWCGLQITTTTLGLFKKGFWRWTSWKIYFFFNFWPVFWPVLTVFLLLQKNLGGSVWKNNFRPKSNFSHAKVDTKAKKYAHFV